MLKRFFILIGTILGLTVLPVVLGYITCSFGIPPILGNNMMGYWFEGICVVMSLAVFSWIIWLCIVYVKG